MTHHTISGFSKLSKQEKLIWLTGTFFNPPEPAAAELESYWLPDPEFQNRFDGFSENTLTNFILPWGIAPNFLINGKIYAVPMVTEESSVVAAAASAAKYWLDRGGFHAEVLGTTKVGQVHFAWNGDVRTLQGVFEELKNELRQDAAALTASMEARGGGISGIELVDFTALEPHYFQLKATFDTCDSMGANFINSVLESFAKTLDRFIGTHPAFSDSERHVSVIMSILSNYTPECLVRAWVECPLEALGTFSGGLTAGALAEKFRKAVRIAHLDPHRATTHNKGIFNGIDAVVIATANDFRAVEACGHTYAARDGQYRSLSHCTIENGTFRFWLDLPLALGTVGGLTRLHPIAARSLELLGQPSARELMMIVACVGLAQNFAAVRSLVTTGIQQGHMKMHLANVLATFNATDQEAAAARMHFEARVVSYSGVRDFLDGYRLGLRQNEKQAN